jgi:hypothetical protein
MAPRGVHAQTPVPTRANPLMTNMERFLAAVQSLSTILCMPGSDVRLTSVSRSSSCAAVMPSSPYPNLIQTTSPKCLCMSVEQMQATSLVSAQASAKLRNGRCLKKETKMGRQFLFPFLNYYSLACDAARGLRTFGSSQNISPALFTPWA